MFDIVLLFQNEIRSYNLSPPNHIEPGEFYRIPGVGKSQRNTSGYCKLFLDLQGGLIGDYSSGLRVVWFPERTKLLNQKELEAIKQRQFEAEEAKQLLNLKSEKEVKELWGRLPKASNDHPYLKKKGVKAYGLKEDQSRLVIPLGIDRKLYSLQHISAEGEKRFFRGTRTQGCYYSIGSPIGTSVLCIAEGYATGATVYEATGNPVAVAFSLNNLLSVSKKMRELFPKYQLVLCADNDLGKEDNPGLSEALKAARAVGGVVAIPSMEEIR